MKREYMEEALQEISDRHIAEAVEFEVEVGKKKRFAWKPVVALAAAIAILVGVTVGNDLIPGGDSALRAMAVGVAVYPEMAPYPDETKYIKLNGEFDDDGFDAVYKAWREDMREQKNQPEGYSEGADQFAMLTIPQFLSGAGEENVVYSPLNVYMALAMAAEITDGNGRQQLLELLGADSIETLRWKALAVWNAHYCNDTATTSVLASSLWLDDSVNYRKSAIETLAENYYASSYQGDMQSGEMNEALKSWLNEQTGGLLNEQVEGVEFDAETVLALATTVYLREKWENDFSESQTKTDVFHALSGDVQCEFMYQSSAQNYYWAEKFGATYKALENGDMMWFILPDEGVTVDDVLADSQLTAFLSAGYDWENSKRVITHLYLPKFDVSSKLDLVEKLQDLGVTDIFTPGKADFSPIADNLPNAYFTEVEHAARVAVDEEGVTAAAYTVMMEAGSTEPPTDEIEFKLDRPFIFAITGYDGLPMFVGVVNQPN